MYFILPILVRCLEVPIIIGIVGRRCDRLEVGLRAARITTHSSIIGYSPVRHQAIAHYGTIFQFLTIQRAMISANTNIDCSHYPSSSPRVRDTTPGHGIILRPIPYT